MGKSDGFIAHRNRLVRFGYGYFEAFCERHHTNLVIIDVETLSPEQELVQDLVAILTVFSARLHGLRSYKKAIRDAALQKNQVRKQDYQQDPKGTHCMRFPHLRKQWKLLKSLRVVTATASSTRYR